MLAGLTLAGEVRAAAMNDNGDVTLVWGTGDGSAEAMFVNDRKVVAVGDPVDLDGDGVAEPASRLTSLRSPEAMAMTDRRGDGQVAIYFIASLDSDGGEPPQADTTALLRVVLRPKAACLTDFNADGEVNSSDLSAYITAWLDDLNNGTTLADFDANGVTNSSDQSAFMAVWLAEAAACQ